jgi:hypothetical protein
MLLTGMGEGGDEEKKKGKRKKKRFQSFRVPGLRRFRVSKFQS